MSTATLPATANGAAAHDPFDLTVPPPGDGNFETCPAGMHPGVLVGLVHLGTHTEQGDDGSREVKKAALLFELPAEHKQDGTPHVLGLEVTLSLHAKAKLRGIVEGWLGRKLGDDEKFPVGSLLGQPCTINVVHSQGKGDKAKNTYHNIAAIGPVMKGFTVPAPHHAPFVFVLTPAVIESRAPLDEPWFPYLYGRTIKDKIEDSKEWKARWNRAPVVTDEDLDKVPF